jgi:hypothetical protein
MKECGECTWCCFFCDIPEYDSPVNQYCRNCDVGHGCKIYEDRKGVCKDFECFWKLEALIPDYLRPDKCGVMFEVPNNCKTFVGYVDPNNYERWKEQRVQILIQKIIDINHPVVIFQGIGKDNIVFTIPGMNMIDVKNDVFNAFRKMQ